MAQNENLERLRISALTVISWLAAVLGMTAWLGWAALSNRLDNIEAGKTVPMAEVTRQRFDQIDRARSRIELQFDRYDERLHDVEQRVRGLEARQRDADR